MKKHLLAALLGVLVFVEVLVSWSAHLRERAAGFAHDPPRKIRLLERASRLDPWNETVHFELGRAYFDAALSDLDDPGQRDAFLAKSTGSFQRSLRLDPVSAAGHFHYGQSLLYGTYLGSGTSAAVLEEYKKAALLTGHNTQIYFEVGKFLLSRWDSLPEEEKGVFRDILRRLLEGRDPAKLRALLEIWALHSGDTALIESIIPADAGVLRSYAAFLGERSLALGRRKEALARAESLDFQRAGSEYELGQRAFGYFQPERARGHLSECLRLLEGIRFYGGAAGRSGIDDEDYTGILRDTHLLLAKIEIDRSRSLADPNFHMRTYLSLEDRVSGVAAFETFLRERALLAERGTALERTDLTFLSFEMTLDFLQNRYRDITRLGEALENRLLVVPDGARADYVEILRLIGESSFKLDYVYEAERYFHKALELDPANLEVLLGLERCYERRNDRAKIAEVKAAVSSLLTPGDLPLESPALAKGETRTIEIVSDGRPTDFLLDLSAASPGLRPLVTVEFGGKVVFEEFLDGGPATFSATPETGPDEIRVRPVNAPVSLIRLRSAAK
jgi:tetratricopeptide (TPR) repeat protein